MLPPLVMQPIRRRTIQVYAGPLGDTFENFTRLWTAHRAFENFLHVIGQGLTRRFGSFRQLSMQPIWDVAYLDHL